MAGPGGQPNMQQLMKQAQKMQQQLMEAQAELAETEVTGTAGGGLVTAIVTGSGEVRRGEDRPEGGRPRRRRDARGPGPRRDPRRGRATPHELQQTKMGPLAGGLGGLGLPGI